MTLPEWTARIRGELEAAGFAVLEYGGFPLVKRPEKFEDGVRLLKLRLSMSCEKRIYAEGMLFLPLGTARAANSLAEPPKLG